MDVVKDILRLIILIYSMSFRRTEAANLVLMNKGITIGRGQMGYLTEMELKFNIPKDRDSCKVEVVQNEPMTQRVGKLTPQVFGCHFLSDEVKYVHNGSPLLEEDSVMLRVYRFSELETVTETFLLCVHITNPVLSIVRFGHGYLEVPEFLGLSSKPVDRNLLSFKYKADRPGTVCTVRITSSETLFPAYGQIVAEDPKLQRRGDAPHSPLNINMRKVRQVKLPCPSNKVCHPGMKEVNFLKAKCEDFLQMGLRYQHLSPPSPDVDYIPIQVEIRDEKSRFQLQTENVWIPVTIKGAVANTQPQAAFMPMFILEIDQFILTPLTTAAIDAEDNETPKDKLVFNVSSPPAEGYITHLDDHTKAVKSFTWKDLYDMKIAYQPPNVTHMERRNYEVEFEAIDGFFMSSPPIMVHFSIRTSETNAPRVAWNMGLDLLEGQSRPITWETFQIVDNDNLDSVQLVIVEGLQHGRLMVRGGKAFTFTVKDIQDGVVCYSHDDSDTTKDYIIFRIFDGKHSIRHRFPINILPKDDSPPFLAHNLVLELAEGEMVLLERHVLLASDFDSSDDYILYSITKPPRAGGLIKKHFLEDSGVPVTSFLQRNLFYGLIYYHHLGGEIFEDSFEFILSDNHEPPNLSNTQTVAIHILPVKDQLPKEAPGAKRHLVVKETEIAYITKDHLHFTDTESPDSELMYSVTKPCFSPDPAGIYDAGKLVFIGNTKSIKRDPFLPALKSFTQHAISHRKVAYMPPQGEIGPDPLLVQFEFSVSDQQGGVVNELLFNITVMPVNDEAPEIFTSPLKTEEGASSYITRENLIVTDADSKRDDLRIQLKKRPHHGNIEVHGAVMLEGETFTLQELNSFNVRYQHDDSETFDDVVMFSATDGLNTADGVLAVQILPVNDEAPELRAGLQSGLECAEGGYVTITAENVYATDADSDDTKLMYMVARAPVYGVLQKGGTMVDKFSQHDVTQGLMSYSHTGGEIGHSPVMDSLTLIVSDGEAGTMDGCCYDGPLPPPVPLHLSLPVYDLNITVLPINNQPPSMSIGQMFIVDEGSSAFITLDCLNASDMDTYSEELIFVLETSPQYGYLENRLPSPGFEKSNAGIDISSFSLQDLKAGHINYVQSKHEHVEPSADHFMIHVSDGVQKSLAMPFYVIINPANDEIPDLKIQNVTVVEGGVCEMGPGTLDAEDLDVPQDTLSFSVASPPSHGVLVNGIYSKDSARYKQTNAAALHPDLQIHSFDLEELKQGMMLLYMHDDTESVQDSFTIQLTDGRHVVQRTVHVCIMPVNDERPHLIRNTGLQVEAAESKVISSAALEVEDQDSPRNKVYYIINNEAKFGSLRLKAASAWITVHPGMNFTQEDVDMNRLWYFHTAILGSKGYDSFRFYVTDGERSSPPESFYISIKNMDKGDIVLLTKPVTLTEGDRVTLTTDVLMATDGTGKPEKLLYAVSVPPVHGQIEHINYPGVPISSFSQLDVAAQKVCYAHNNSHEAGQDSFSFTISNGLKAADGSMDFIIVHRDHILPTLVSSKGIQLHEGGMRVISRDLLELTDPDSPMDNLTYQVTQHPQHGHLYLKGSIMHQSKFTQADVNNMDLAYRHSGGAGQLDRFLFIASDKINPGFLVNGQMREDPAVFTIQVEREDRAAPVLLVKESPSTVDNLKDGRMAIQVTAHNLKATDVNSKAEDLIYTVLRSPYFGYLENVKTGSYVSDTFTQQDLNQKAIRYIINPSAEVTSDSFEFRVSDPAGNTIAPETIEMKWSRVSLAGTCYQVCENAGPLAIKVVRTGQSADPSFVGIKVQEVSARVGLDFTHSAASLVQFDPGVSTKSWKIYIKNDGLEESNEVLKILLSSPRNAVLGKDREATVKIIDPRAGGCNSMDLKPSGTKGVLDRSGQMSEVCWPSPKGAAVESEHHRSFSPRGDVPQTDRLFHYPGVVIAPRTTGKQEQGTGSSRVYRGITPPARAEEQFSPRSDTRVTHLRPSLASAFHRQSRREHPQRDPAARSENGRPKNKTKGKKARQCASGWTLRDKHCYLLNAVRNATWESAEKACSQTPYAHLTSVHSKREMKWLWRFAGMQPFWIGLVETGEHHGWIWTNGRPVTINNLKQGKTERHERAQRKCALVKREKRWAMKDCNRGQRERYVCSAPSLRRNAPALQSQT
ncbi:LOW QUALITY PROTEIN: FRAS1-related extracellular matrix protein 1-like [Rhinatrema bivittatum]|uniref:LOW QUALITY PROTEIN: FRAS1-related extracellular matrix protein 1-like n=1 Tax=Rhinatrema bivittatum TaxID=194408 RepID=UPI00112EB2AD|nr:LOW QUALITY PROTEIN: FRAS1-related extracellular matrix protein 1-like [Rhinatrema bivittatum]